MDVGTTSAGTGLRGTSEDLDLEPPVVVRSSCNVVFGLFHFLGRPALWLQLICPVLTTLCTTVVSLALLFIFLLTPQAQLLILRWHWPGWLAWSSSVIAVFAECATVNVIVLLAFFGCVQSAIFRAVLEERGVLAQLRAEHGGELQEAYCFRDLGHTILFLAARSPLLVVTLPLNSFPVVGQIVWVFLNGWLYAWELTAEFMVMLEDRHRCCQQWQFVKKHFGAYVSFGAAAMGLELVPILGPWLFFASNACGAAFLAERFFAETHVQDGNTWRHIERPEPREPNSEPREPSSEHSTELSASWSPA